MGCPHRKTPPQEPTHDRPLPPQPPPARRPRHPPGRPGPRGAAVHRHVLLRRPARHRPGAHEGIRRVRRVSRRAPRRRVELLRPRRGDGRAGVPVRPRRGRALAGLAQLDPGPQLRVHDRKARRARSAHGHRLQPGHLPEGPGGGSAGLERSLRDLDALVRRRRGVPRLQRGLASAQPGDRRACRRRGQPGDTEHRLLQAHHYHRRRAAPQRAHAHGWALGDHDRPGCQRARLRGPR